MLWGHTGVGLLWEQGWVWGETTALSDYWSSATFLGMVGGQCVWELGRARLSEAEGELRPGSIQDKARLAGSARWGTHRCTIFKAP